MNARMFTNSSKCCFLCENPDIRDLVVLHQCPPSKRALEERENREAGFSSRQNCTCVSNARKRWEGKVHHPIQNVRVSNVWKGRNVSNAWKRRKGSNPPPDTPRLGRCECRCEVQRALSAHVGWRRSPTAARGAGQQQRRRRCRGASDRAAFPRQQQQWSARCSCVPARPACPQQQP